MSDVFYFEDFDHGCDLEPEIFSCQSSVDNGIEHPYNVVRWNAMSKGGVKVDHPMDELYRVTYSWRHVILHRKRYDGGRTLWYSFVHRRLVDNIQYVVGKVCAFDLQFGHDILLSFESAVFYDTQNVSDRC